MVLFGAKDHILAVIWKRLIFRNIKPRYSYVYKDNFDINMRLWRILFVFVNNVILLLT